MSIKNFFVTVELCNQTKNGYYCSVDAVVGLNIYILLIVGFGCV